MAVDALQQLPSIDFSDLDLDQPDTDAWHAARVRLMSALETHGSFVAVYDRLSPDLRQSLFGRAMDDAFSLPLEAKMKSVSDVPFQAYIGGIPGMAFESIHVDNSNGPEAADNFTRLMWPHGNPHFFNTVWSASKLLVVLELMIWRMILQSFGIEEKYFALHAASTAYGLRLSKYGGGPFNPEAKNGMDAHKDTNIMTMICQSEVEGLEVEARNGEWIRVVPTPNSFTVVIGEAFHAWTNGRLKATMHRVRIESTEIIRYSSLFGARPREGFKVETADELVDELHPLLYNAYDYYDYLRYRFSEEGSKLEDALKAFCGKQQGSQGHHS